MEAVGGNGFGDLGRVEDLQEAFDCGTVGPAGVSHDGVEPLVRIDHDREGDAGRAFAVERLDRLRHAPGVGLGQRHDLDR